ncbi:MAG: alpha/beta hydrolase [Candidatus Cloacimonetes bacterium]|nr:alpha/beta hydrolase [Candidatus Cloacimonadota bacterium]
MQAKDTLINLDDSSFIKDSKVKLINTGNDIQLRLAQWPPSTGTEPKGTVLIVQGYSEFIEKYEEVVSEFRDKGYSVVAYDSRGQGLSTRFISDFHKGYVDSYSAMVNDLQQVYDEVVSTLPRPHILLAHSMGGNVSMRFLQEKKPVFDHAFLSAPMLAWNEPVGAVSMLASALVFLGRGEKYAIGAGPPNSDIKAAISERLSSDKNRVNKVASYCAKEARLWMGGPTWQWVKEASKSILVAVTKANCVKVTTSTTILSPLDDVVISGANHKTLASYNKNIECIEFTGAKHEILIEEDIHREKFWNTFHSVFPK